MSSPETEDEELQNAIEIVLQKLPVIPAIVEDMRLFPKAIQCADGRGTHDREEVKKQVEIWRRIAQKHIDKCTTPRNDVFSSHFFDRLWHKVAKPTRDAYEKHMNKVELKRKAPSDASSPAEPSKKLALPKSSKEFLNKIRQCIVSLTLDSSLIENAERLIKHMEDDDGLILEACDRIVGILGEITGNSTKREENFQDSLRIRAQRAWLLHAHLDGIKIFVDTVKETSGGVLMTRATASITAFLKTEVARFKKVFEQYRDSMKREEEDEKEKLEEMEEEQREDQEWEELQRDVKILKENINDALSGTTGAEGE